MGFNWLFCDWRFKELSRFYVAEDYLLHKHRVGHAQKDNFGPPLSTNWAGHFPIGSYPLTGVFPPSFYPINDTE